jgi:hypothetical protein
MQKKLVITLVLDTRASDERVARLFESAFEFGTVREAIATSLDLRRDPTLLSVQVSQASADKP